MPEIRASKLTARLERAFYIDISIRTLHLPLSRGHLPARLSRHGTASNELCTCLSRACSQTLTAARYDGTFHDTAASLRQEDQAHPKAVASHRHHPEAGAEASRRVRRSPCLRMLCTAALRMSATSKKGAAIRGLTCVTRSLELADILQMTCVVRVVVACVAAALQSKWVQYVGSTQSICSFLAIFISTKHHSRYLQLHQDICHSLHSSPTYLVKKSKRFDRQCYNNCHLASLLQPEGKRDQGR